MAYGGEWFILAFGAFMAYVALGVGSEWEKWNSKRYAEQSKSHTQQRHRPHGAEPHFPSFNCRCAVQSPHETGTLRHREVD